MVTKQLNIKNRIYYFCNNLINTKEFDPKVLKLNESNLITFLCIVLAMLQKTLSTVLTV